MALGQGAFVFLVPVFSHELGAGLASASFIFALIGIGVLSADIPAGLLVARLGEKKTMFIALFSLFLLNLCATQVSAIWQLAILTWAVGFGSGTWLFARLHFVTHNVDIAVRGRAMSVLGGIQRFGAFAGPIIAGFIAELIQTNAAYYFTAGTTVLGAAMVLFHLPTTSAASLQPHTHLSTSIEIFKSYLPIFRTAGLSIFCLQLIRGARQVALPLWAIAIGLSPSENGLVYGLGFFIDMCLFYPAGFIMDRKGRKWALIPCLAIIATAICLLPLSVGFYSLLAISLLAAVGNGLGAGINMTLGADYSPKDRSSAFLGVWRFTGDMGASVGPILMGGLINLFTLSVACVGLAGVGYFGAWLASTKVQETRAMVLMPDEKT